MTGSMLHLQASRPVLKMAVGEVSKRSVRTYSEDGREKDATIYQARTNPRHGDTMTDTEKRRGSSSTSTSQSSVRQSDHLPTGQVAPTDLAVHGRPDLPVGDLIPAHDALESTEGIDAYPLREKSNRMDGLVSAAGQPINFGMVVPGVYRSSYPRVENFAFFEQLHLKTIVTLVQKDLPEGYQSFLLKNGIRHVVFNMQGTKKEAIPSRTMKSILRLVLDQKNHPLLIHCNHGKHRTGCVVAAVRKVSGWEVGSIVTEYRAYAEPKVRECDIKYITAFDLSDISGLHATETNMRIRARNFLRAVFVSFCVLLLWIASSSSISAPRRKLIR